VVGQKSLQKTNRPSVVSDSALVQATASSQDKTKTLSLCLNPYGGFLPAAEDYPSQEEDVTIRPTQTAKTKCW